MLFLAIRAASSDLVQAVATALISIVVFFAIVVIVWLTVIRRRKRRGAVAAAPASAGGHPGDDAGDDARDHALAARANILLVELDDTVALAEEKRGFAITRFGEDRCSSFTEALATCRRDLTEAFRLKQLLNDSPLDSITPDQEGNSRIIRLCESSQNRLADLELAFDSLSRGETDASAELSVVRMLVVSTSMRVPATETTLVGLSARYSSAALGAVSGNVGEARALLTTAGRGAQIANADLADPVALDVFVRVHESRTAANKAARLLDAVDSLGATLEEQSGRLHQLAAEGRADLAEARAAGDSTLDPNAGAHIRSAASGLEAALGSLDTGDPAGSLARLEGAAATLDGALEPTRDQPQRIEHASAALAGVLVTARCQIAATQAFIASRRGSVGADARTSLAEARRLLGVAESQADPVTALDSARGSAAHSRDADSLARSEAPD